MCPALFVNISEGIRTIQILNLGEVFKIFHALIIQILFHTYHHQIMIFIDKG